MFNTTENHYHDSTQYTTVHEHRAPTDESVRLLKEMEDAAKQKILDSVVLENNLINAKVHYQLEPMSQQHMFLIQTMINGKRIDTTVRIDTYNIDINHIDGKRQVATKIHEELSKAIAAEIFENDVVPTLAKRL